MSGKRYTEELKVETVKHGTDRGYCRRYQKPGGEYMQKSKFNISSRDQARCIIETLGNWMK